MHLFINKKLIYDTYMKRKVTRFAPTPSGHLHFGNFCNLIFTYWFAKQNNAILKLRVDDYDYFRCKPKYIESLFRILDMINIDFVNRPQSIDDFYLHYSQKLKTEYYYKRLDEVTYKYVCECSRNQFKGQKVYPGSCRNKELSFKQNQTQWRYQLPKDLEELESQIGDFVLWRKENIIPKEKNRNFGFKS